MQLKKGIVEILDIALKQNSPLDEELFKKFQDLV